MSVDRILVKFDIDESPSARGLPRLLTIPDCDSDQSRRVGFTLCELLFIIGIITILLALLVPAVQQSREAARRAKCRNTLNHLGIAIQNYSVVHGSFPIGVVNQTGPIRFAAQGYHFSWLARILPQLDQRAVFENLNFKVSVYDELNRAPRSQDFPIFRCPSDQWDGSNQFPGSNYAGCHHHVEAPIDDDNHGAFVLNRTLTFVDFGDGRVSFLTETTTVPVLKMMADRADGHEKEQAF